MSIRRTWLVLLLCAAFSAAWQPAAAQDVSVRASVDETIIGTEETVTFRLEIHGVSFADVQTPQAPATENLVLVQPVPSTQRNITVSNGRLKQSIAYHWVYRPVRAGPARIRETEVTVQGKRYETAEIAVNVVPQSRRPQQQRGRLPRHAVPYPGQPQDEEPEERETAFSENDLFIRAIPSARRAYSNEQITVEYRLYFRQGIQLRQSRLADSWDAEGFWREELDVESRPIPHLTVENGLRYHTITLKRVAVFATRAGTMEIDPLRIESEAFIPYRSSDPFEQFFSLRSRFETVEINSPAVRIDVEPLPAGAPADFQGTVGSFRMQTTVNREELKVGDPLEVRVTLTGTGNLATLSAPTFEAPGIFERYDPQVSTAIQRDGPRIRGTKTFTYILVPRSNGTFELPPLTFSYFDPARATYETLRSEPIPVRVTGTPAEPLTTGTLASGLPVDDIAGLLHAPAAWAHQAATPLHQRPWVYAALLLPLVALGALSLLRRHATRLETDVGYARNRRAHPLARKHLREAEALLRKDRPHPFYEEVERAVLGFIGNRLNIPERGLTRHQLDARLAAAGLPEETRRAVQALLDTCDRGRFAPTRPERAALRETYDRAGGLIAEIDDLLRQQTTANLSPLP